jgi:alkylhydroperoxidase family enzyme
VERQRRLWAGAHHNKDPYLGALLKTPPLAATIATLGQRMRSGQLRGTYSDADREFVDVVMSVDFGYNAILALHIPDALAVGVRIEAVDALRAGRDDLLDDRERALAAYIRQVVSGTVTDGSYADMIARLGERGALEYTVFIAFLVMTMRLWQALGVPEPTDEEVDELLRGFRSGEHPMADPAARIG